MSPPRPQCVSCGVYGFIFAQSPASLPHGQSSRLAAQLVDGSEKPRQRFGQIECFRVVILGSDTQLVWVYGRSPQRKELACRRWYGNLCLSRTNWRSRKTPSASAARCSLQHSTSSEHQHQLPTRAWRGSSASSARSRNLCCSKTTLTSISSISFSDTRCRTAHQQASAASVANTCWEPGSTVSLIGMTSPSLPQQHKPHEHHQHQLPDACCSTAPPASISSISCPHQVVQPALSASNPRCCCSTAHPASISKISCVCVEPGSSASLISITSPSMPQQGNPPEHHLHQHSNTFGSAALPARISGISCQRRHATRSVQLASSS